MPWVPSSSPPPLPPARGRYCTLFSKSSIFSVIEPWVCFLSSLAGKVKCCQKSEIQAGLGFFFFFFFLTQNNSCCFSTTLRFKSSSHKRGYGADLGFVLGGREWFAAPAESPRRALCGVAGWGFAVIPPPPKRRDVIFCGPSSSDGQVHFLLPSWRDVKMNSNRLSALAFQD